ncbi:MAG: metalloregulator ArsR/SmtB family transcription factor [Streptococcaceae bacterium]|jgi:DNA-binding transcriptional ArsR family regulator|nr:metalloregulator ArsR/SmtB family transcription factor [Streptococcaceae bacterium]
MTIEQQNLMDDKRIQIFKALSDQTRLEILRLMVKNGDANHEISCTPFFETLHLSKSTISFHLKTLREAGLTFRREEGRQTFVRLNLETFKIYLPGFLESL